MKRFATGIQCTNKNRLFIHRGMRSLMVGVVSQDPSIRGMERQLQIANRM